MLIVTKKYCLLRCAHFLSQYKQSVSLTLNNTFHGRKGCCAGESVAGIWLCEREGTVLGTGTARHEAAQTLIAEDSEA